MQLPLTQDRGFYIPAGLPRIDWSNPITNGLKNVWMFEGGNIPRSLVNGRVLSVGTKPSTGNSSAGGGCLYNGSTQFSSGALGSLSSLNACSMFVFVTPVSLATGQTFFFEGRSDATGGFASCAVDGTDSSKPRFLVKDSLGNSVIVAGSTGTIFNNIPVAIGGDGAWNNVGSVRLYVDGKPSGTPAGAAVSTLGTMNVTTLGAISRFEGNSGFANCIVHMAAEWARQLSPAEHFEIGQNPTSFLIYPEDDIFFEWEAGVRFIAHGPCSLEALGPIKRDSASRLESIAGVNRDTNNPTEWIVGPFTIDTVLPVESITSAKRDEKQPIESLGSLQADRRLPLEYVAGVIRDGKALLESLGKFTQDSKDPLEWLGSTGAIVIDSAMPIEILTSAVAHSVARLENLASIADGAPSQTSGGGYGDNFYAGDDYSGGASSSGGASKKIEILGSIATDTSVNLESVNSIGIAQCIALIEWLGQTISPSNRIFKAPARQSTFIAPARNNIFVAPLN